MGKAGRKYNMQLTKGNGLSKAGCAVHGIRPVVLLQFTDGITTNFPTDSVSTLAYTDTSHVQIN